MQFELSSCFVCICVDVLYLVVDQNVYETEIEIAILFIWRSQKLKYDLFGEEIEMKLEVENSNNFFGLARNRNRNKSRSRKQKQKQKIAILFIWCRQKYKQKYVFDLYFSWFKNAS